MVRESSCVIYDQDVKIEVNKNSLFDGDEHFRSIAKLSLSQMGIEGRILMQQIPNAEKIAIYLGLESIEPEGWGETTTCEHLARTPLSTGKFIPRFDSMTAYNVQLPGLQQLTELSFAGSEFHWALAKLPRLRKLQLSQPCVVLPDEAPNKVNTELKLLKICAQSDILRSNSNHYSNLGKFLAHFPSLEDMEITIYDLEVDVLQPLNQSDPPDEAEQSYSTLLERLDSVAEQLQRLHLLMYNAEDNWSTSASRFLLDVQPASGFQDFKKLTGISVPSQCLFRKISPTVDTVPSPAAVLPAAFEYLTIDCPQVHIYDWLLQLRKVRDELPDLFDIELHCQLPFGDEWPVLAFKNDDHPVFDILANELDINLYVTKREQDWKAEWDEYDASVPDVIDWLDDLGGDGGMDKLLEWINFKP